MGQRPLFFAAWGGHIEVVTTLMKAGADMNQKDINGKSALIMAAERSHIEAVKILLKVESELKGTIENTID